MESHEIDVSQLRVSIDNFYRVLSDSNEWKSTPSDILKLRETTKSDLSNFVNAQDKHHPNCYLAQALGSVQTIFELMHEALEKLFKSDQNATFLPPLYGVLRAVLLQGNRTVQSPKTPSKLLEEVGRHAGLRSELARGGLAITDVREYYCMASRKILDLCSDYISEGPDFAMRRLSSAIIRIQHARSHKKFASYKEELFKGLLKSHTRKLSDNPKGGEILKWLKAPDPSSYFQAARELYQENTGLWLLSNNPFLKWKIDENPLLWLYGKPGCGKTLLSSTAIVEIQGYCQIQPSRTMAYFFFSFTDAEKQVPENMLRSVVTQLLSQHDTIPDATYKLFSPKLDGQQQPSKDELLDLLREIAASFAETYIILDALDESGNRQSLLDLIYKIHKLELKSLHLMVTSRQEVDIEDGLDEVIESDGKISAQTNVVDEDIRVYIRHRVHFDPGFKKWKQRPDVQREIKETLMKKADGMFRWAACQLKVLCKCPNLPMLRKEMAGLPKTLDETYAMILRKIPDEYQSFAVKLLQWLIYSLRPLTIEEMVEVFAIESGSNPTFDPDARFPEPRDVLLICPGLVISVITKNLTTGAKSERLRLAHFSVQEYLISTRVDRDIAIYKVNETAAHNTIATDCLCYLLYFHNSNSKDYESMMSCGGERRMNTYAHIFFSYIQYSFLRYVSSYWEYHTRFVDGNSSCISLALEVLTNNSLYSNTFDILSTISTAANPYGSPLCWMSKSGNMRMVKSILSVESPSEDALQGASEGGHADILSELLASGADVNGRFQGHTALWHVSFAGHTAIAKQLLAAGAQVEAGDLISGTTPLQQASVWGREENVKLLLASGADPNIIGDEGCGTSGWGKPLHEALRKGYWDIVKQLLLAGADFQCVCPEFDRWAFDTLKAAGFNLEDMECAEGPEIEDEFSEQYKTLEEKALGRIVRADAGDPKIGAILCR